MCNPSGLHLQFRSRLVSTSAEIQMPIKTPLARHFFILFLPVYTSPLFGKLFLVILSHTSSAKTKKIRLFPHFRMWNYFKLFDTELGLKIRIGRICTKTNTNNMFEMVFFLENFMKFWYYSVCLVNYCTTISAFCEVFIELTHLWIKSHVVLNVFQSIVSYRST